MQHEKLIELRRARAAWHEKNGVPVSDEYARFLRAIGEIEDSFFEPQIDPRLSIAIHALKEIKNRPRPKSIASTPGPITSHDIANKALDDIIFIRVAPGVTGRTEETPMLIKQLRTLESQITSGEWSVCEPDDGSNEHAFAVIQTSTEGQFEVILCELEGLSPYRDVEGPANAALIALAPKMLKFILEAASEPPTPLNRNDTVDYWKARATTAELKVLTFHEEIVKLAAPTGQPKRTINPALVAAGGKEFVCKARAANMGANDPQECDWPSCGCDPYADRVIAAIQESGYEIVKGAPTGQWVKDAARAAAEEANDRNRLRGHVLTAPRGEWDHIMPTEELAAIIEKHLRPTS